MIRKPRLPGGALRAAAVAAAVAVPMLTALLAEEKTVTWTGAVNVSIVNGSLQQTAGCDGCGDAGATSLEALTQGDGFVQFTVGEPLLRAQAAPKNLVRFAYSDPGLNFYGNGIIATDTTIKSNPDLVRRFVAATIKGLKASIDAPADAGAIMNKAHPEVSVDVAKGETEAVAELAQVKGKPLAEIDPAGVQATIDVVNGAFKLKSPVTVSDIYVPGFVAK